MSLLNQKRVSLVIKTLGVL